MPFDASGTLTTSARSSQFEPPYSEGTGVEGEGVCREVALEELDGEVVGDAEEPDAVLLVVPELLDWAAGVRGATGPVSVVLCLQLDSGITEASHMTPVQESPHLSVVGPMITVSPSCLFSSLRLE